MSAASLALHRVAGIDARVEPFDWFFARERAHDIAAHWSASLKSKPEMFDGRVLLAHHWAIETRDGQSIVRSMHFETAFSAFFAWREFGFPDRSVRNCFAMAALRGADGGFILGEMGAHTAVAGRIYFPAGTPDLSDVVCERLDLSGSVIRELGEETGLRLDEVEIAADWVVVDAGPYLACMRPIRVDAPAAEVARDIERRLAAQTRPELARVHVVQGPEHFDGERMPGFVIAYMREAFNGGLI